MGNSDRISGNYNAATFGNPTSGNTFNLYFAAESNVVPSNCTEFSFVHHGLALRSLSSDRKPVPDATGTSAARPCNRARRPNLRITGHWRSGACDRPLSAVESGISRNCGRSNRLPSNTDLSVLRSRPTPSARRTIRSASASAWSLIDGYLRVEYKDTSGNWNPDNQ